MRCWRPRSSSTTVFGAWVEVGGSAPARAGAELFLFTRSIDARMEDNPVVITSIGVLEVYKIIVQKREEKTTLLSV